MDPATFKAIADGVTSLVNLPDLLIKMVMDPQVTYWDRRERIQKLKELAELRELGRVLVDLVIVKGGIIGIVDRLRQNPTIEDASWVRRDLEIAADLLEDVLEIMREASFSNTSLVAEAATFITTIQKAYRMLSEATDEALVASGKLGDLFEGLIKVHEAGLEMMKKIEPHRRTIDGMTGIVFS